MRPCDFETMRIWDCETFWPEDVETIGIGEIDIWRVREFETFVVRVGVFKN